MDLSHDADGTQRFDDPVSKIQTVNSNDIAGVLLDCAGKDEHMLVRKLVAGFAMRLRSNNENASQAAAEILQLSATFTCEGELDSERAWWMDGNTIGAYFQLLKIKRVRYC